MAQFKSRTQEKNGLGALEYLGVRPVSPQNFFIKQRVPTTSDYRNAYVGDLWLDNTSMYLSPSVAPDVDDLWILTSVVNNIATWRNFGTGSGAIPSLTSNSGGPVFPLANNINIVGDGISIVGVGVPGTHTITLSTSGTGVMSSLTGDNAIPVFPLAGNTNLIGTPGNISVTGNAGTHTLQLNIGDSVAIEFVTDVGTAIPIAGILKIITDLPLRGCGSTVLFEAPGASNIVQLKVTDADRNTIIGDSSGNTGATGVSTTILGWASMTDAFTGDQNVCIGNGIMSTATTANRNTAVGYQCMLSGVTASLSTAVGVEALGSSGDDTENCAFGYLSGELLNGGDRNNFFGAGSGANLLTGSDNLFLGRNSAFNLLTGSNNFIAGNSAGSALTGAESNNVLINHAGVEGASGSIIIANGAGILFITTDMIDNQFVGINSGNTTMTGVNNTVFGANSLTAATTINNNTLFGNKIMTTATNAGIENTIFGDAAYNIGTGNYNCLIGSDAGMKCTTASNNTFLGIATAFDEGAALGLTTGVNNILIGYNVGAAYRGNESNNIIIGALAVVSESNVCKIGKIRGVTTNVNNAIAVLIDSAGQLGTVSSSARYKEDIEDMGQDSDVLFKLRPVTFKYKKHPAGYKSVGLIAEEVAVCAPKLVVYDNEGIPETVKYHDLVPMLLNEVIKLRKELDDLKNRND